MLLTCTNSVTDIFLFVWIWPRHIRATYLVWYIFRQKIMFHYWRQPPTYEDVCTCTNALVFFAVETSLVETGPIPFEQHRIGEILELASHRMHGHGDFLPCGKLDCPVFFSRGLARNPIHARPPPIYTLGTTLSLWHHPLWISLNAIRHIVMKPFHFHRESPLV